MTDVVSPAWQKWVAENLLAGSSVASITDALLKQNVTRDEAEAVVASVATSPIFAAAHAVSVKSRRWETVSKLMCALERSTLDPASVERVSGLRGAEFFARYYAPCAPVVLTDVVPRWRAYGLWSPQFFIDRIGDVDVEITDDRERDPDYDMNARAHSRVVKLAEFARRVLAAGVTNDLYLVANNRNMDRPELQVLYDDVTLDPEYFDLKRLAGSVALWFGPAGTVTPLHHDTSNILLCQVVGRKRVRLVSPWEPSLLHDTRGVYSPLDPESPDLQRFQGFARATVRDVTLAPGEALFIPAGWWHHVRALDVSINMAFTNFVRPNFLDWYRPGAIG